MRHFIQMSWWPENKNLEQRHETLKKKKKEEIDKNITENHQTKIADRNKRKRNNGDIEQPETKG